MHIASVCYMFISGQWQAVGAALREPQYEAVRWRIFLLPPQPSFGEMMEVMEQFLTVVFSMDNIHLMLDEFQQWISFSHPIFDSCIRLIGEIFYSLLHSRDAAIGEPDTTQGFNPHIGNNLLDLFRSMCCMTFFFYCIMPRMSHAYWIPADQLLDMIEQFKSDNIGYRTSFVGDVLEEVLSHDDIDERYYTARLMFQHWCMAWSHLFRDGWRFDLLHFLSFDVNTVAKLMDLTPPEDEEEPVWNVLVETMVKQGFFTLVFSWYDCFQDKNAQACYAKIVANAFRAVNPDKGYTAKVHYNGTPLTISNPSFSSWMKENPSEWGDSGLTLDIQRSLCRHNARMQMLQEIGVRNPINPVAVAINVARPMNPRKRRRDE